MSSIAVSRFAEIGVEWFAEALRAPITASEVTDLPFTGATTDIARIRFSYGDGGGGPASVIAKITGRDEVRQAMEAAMGLSARESRFFDTFAGSVPVRVPRCFYVGDGTTTPLLFEDLGHLRMGDQVAGLARDDAERIVTDLAALHARYWQTPDVAQEWLLDPAGDEYVAIVADLVASGREALADRLTGRVPASTLAAALERASDWRPLLTAAVTGPRTIVHYDTRLDNIFFAQDGAPVFIDWQGVAGARGTHDIALLLTQSMDVALLRANWESLLRRYHSALLDHGVPNYSWPQCAEDYRQNVPYSLGAALALLGDMNTGDGRELGDVIAFRALHHIHDLDAFAAF